MNKFFFTESEGAHLIANGWEILPNKHRAEKNYHKIVKQGDNDFEVSVCITDEPDGNDYWEFDSEWTSIEEAVRRA